MKINPNIEKRIKERKKQLDSLRPFSKNILLRIREYFDVELTYNSNAIEGNTLDLQETRAVLEDGITVGGKSMREHLEVTNHKKAIDFVFSLIKKKEIKEMDILELHALVMDRILPEEAGFYRHTQVYIRGSKHIPPSHKKIPELMKGFVKLLNSKKDALELAAEVHYEFVHIHPFVDGNGRVGRLLMNLILLKNGYPITVILKAERKKYLDCLEKANKGDYDFLLNFIAKSVERSLNIYLGMIDSSFSSEYISLAEAAKKSNHSQEYLSLLARKGELGAIKFGRNWVITKKTLEKYLESK